jgi:hypothetical protein
LSAQRTIERRPSDITVPVPDPMPNQYFGMG